MPVRDTWWEQMECRDSDPAIFEEPPKAPPGKRYRHDPKWAEEALTLCRRCPVSERCLDEALSRPAESEREFLQRYVIGGVMPKEFDQLRRQQRRIA